MFLITDILQPQVLAAEKDFLIVYKPPRMHSVPLARSAGGETILDWCSAGFPEIMALPGRRAGEGGLLHRLDYETHGLMLLARNGEGMEALLAQQREGKIRKEYSALAAKSNAPTPGFPLEGPSDWFFTAEDNTKGPFKITSAFRPYGPGRKAVRPVLTASPKNKKQGELYTTEVLGSGPVSAEDIPFLLSFRLRISRGFRHQIRSHLAWLCAPIINDSLYGGLSFGKGLLGLRACLIAFNDPSSGEERCYSISFLDPAEI